MQENRFRSLLVAPGLEIRQEGKIGNPLFGDGVESPVSAVMKELHIHKNERHIYITVDNPISGGPIVAGFRGQETVIIPGEQNIFEGHSVTLFIRKGEFIHILIID